MTTSQEIRLRNIRTELLDRLSDVWWRLENLYVVQDENGEQVTFTLRSAQRLFLMGLWYRNIILKARQLGFCLDPSTRVLTADLKWVAIADLQPGEQLVAVDEYPEGGRGKARKMRTATVQAVVSVHRKAYRLTFDDGRQVVCTGQHPWLSKKVSSESDWRSIEATTKKKLTVGTYVKWITKPWGESTYEDGWFGGMLDGEGSLSKSSRAGASINVSQREGDAWNRLNKYCSDNSLNGRIESDEAERPNKHGKTPVPKVVFSRIDEVFRVIGKTRPSRFIGKHWWEGKELPGKRNGDTGWAKITKIEELDHQRMVDLQTSTGTYIAEGFVSHNTTVIAIFALDRCLFNKNFHAGVIAHTKDDVIKIFESKVKFAYENLPDDIRALVPAKTDRANELKFANGSSIRVAVSMRSGTLQLLHISEYGKLWAQFPKKAKEVQTGSLPTVHEKGIVIIESTAEGIGGDYHGKCMTSQATAKAIEKGNRGELSVKEYRFHFFPWWANPKYVLNVPPGHEHTAEENDYFAEAEAIARTKLSPEQRYWYAVTQEELTETMMKQEHPTYPDEAFLFSGRKAFDAKALRIAEKMCMKPVWVGDIDPMTGQMRERRGGNLLIWAQPVENLEYVIGADVAEGLEHGDHSSMDVLDGEGYQVAHYRGHIDPDLYARVLNWIGLYYRKAFMGVERNNHGHAVLMRLKDLKYQKLYIQRTIDKRTDEVNSGDKVGWLTTSASKPLIIDNLGELLRTASAGIRNIETVNEMHQFVIDSKGRFGAQENCYDDRVMSYAIALEMNRVKPRPTRKFSVTRKSKDWRSA